MKTNYIPSLDGIRAIAVIIVLVSHAGIGNVVPGGLGVTIFFFLSGFLITTLLLEEYRVGNYIHYPKFFARRFLRLFPPLFLTLILAYGFLSIGVVEGEVSFYGLLSQIFYLANYHSIFNWGGGIPNGLGILWSLAVEEHFYLFFPILLYFQLRYFGESHVPYMIAILCIFILGWRNYLVWIENVESIRVYYATDTRIDSILFGCLLAVTCNPFNKKPVANLTAKSIGLLLSAALLLLFSLTYRSEAFRQTFRYSLQGIALMPFFYYSVINHENILFRWLNWSWLKKIGVYSYCIYLIHDVIIRVLEKYGVNDVPVLILMAFLLSITFAFFVDKYVEGYFRRVRKRLH